MSMRALSAMQLTSTLLARSTAPCRTIATARRSARMNTAQSPTPRSTVSSHPTPCPIWWHPGTLVTGESRGSSVTTCPHMPVRHALEGTSFHVSLFSPLAKNVISVASPGWDDPSGCCCTLPSSASTTHHALTDCGEEKERVTVLSSSSRETLYGVVTLHPSQTNENANDAIPFL
eukprot:514102-Rhodomonas_salina.2